MRDILPDLLTRWRAGQAIGMATVIATFQSAPRPPGASMLVCEDGSVVGSVSGGCVEATVYDTAQSVLVSGRSVLERYGVSDDDALAVGLTCGGVLDVFIEKVALETFPELAQIAEDVDANLPVAVATVVEHPDRTRMGQRLIVRPGASGEASSRGTLGSERIDAAVKGDALGVLASG